MAALYHLHVQIIQRTDGRSAVGCAAYRAGDTLYDQRLGKEFDYSRKQGVEESLIFGPVGMPVWLSDRGKLWNAVEAAERINGQPAREFDVALPIELVRKNRRAAMQLARDWAHDMFVVRGLIVDISFHDLDGHNPHFHVMVTTRPLHLHACEFQEGSPKVFGKKDRELNDRSWMLVWRQKWAEYANAVMALHGIDARIDHRSLIDQGITDREPGIHVGPGANAMWEERGIERDRWTQNATIWWCNEQAWFEENDRYVAFLEAEAAEERRLEREAREIVAQAAEFRDLTDRLETAAWNAPARAEKRLRVAGGQIDAAANGLLAITQKSERLDALASRLDNAKSLAVGRASTSLDRAGHLLPAAAKKRWYQEFHRSGLMNRRLEVQGRVISTAIAFEQNAVVQAAERHTVLSHRLHAAATERPRSAVGGLDAATRSLREAAKAGLGRDQERLGATLSGLAEASDQTHANIDANVRRLAELGRRSRTALRLAAQNSEEALQKQALALARAHPAPAVVAWQRAKTAAIYLRTTITSAARTATASGAWLVDAAESGLIRLGQWGEGLYERAKGNEVNERSLARIETPAPPREPDRPVEPDPVEGLKAERLHMLRWLERIAEQEWLPIRRERASVSLEAARLPEGLRKWVTLNADDPAVAELVENEECRREAELIVLFSNAREPLIERDSEGNFKVFVDRFPRHLREHVPGMLQHRRLVRDYAEAAVARWAVDETLSDASDVATLRADVEHGPEQISSRSRLGDEHESVPTDPRQGTGKGKGGSNER